MVNELRMNSAWSIAPAVAGMSQLTRALQPQVVHSLPGRVRLRFGPSAGGEALAVAEQLAAHPAVSSVRWSPMVRSLTVEFQPALSLQIVLLDLPCPGDLRHRTVRRRAGGG